MSGPKDYAVRYALARLQRIRARMEADRMARAAVVQNMLSLQREAAIARMAVNQSAQATVVHAELEKRKQAALMARNQIAPLFKGSNSTSGVQPADAPEASPTRQAGPIESMTIEQPTVVAIEAAADLTSQFVQIRGWTDAMKVDQTVNDFRRAAVAAWRKEADSLLAEVDSNEPTPHLADRCEKVLTDAQRIFDEAGDLKGKFDTRNELLADIIASFKEIGFHVSDPFFEHPEDPTGPAILKATCGLETVTASIDLSAKVRSVWDGVESEQCKDAFFDYVDRMKQRGVDVEAERTDLRERPKLLQKGANELPRNQSNNAGG